MAQTSELPGNVNKQLCSFISDLDEVIDELTADKNQSAHRSGKDLHPSDRARLMGQELPLLRQRLNFMRTQGVEVPEGQTAPVYEPDRPNTFGRERPIEERKLDVKIENSTLMDIVSEFDDLREEMRMAGQTRRKRMGIFEGDYVRANEILDNVENIIVNFADKVTPVDRPISQPDVAM